MYMKVSLRRPPNVGRTIFKTLAATACVCLLTGIATRALAAEGAASNYFPGTYGTLLVGVAPEPGPVFVDLNLFYSAEVDRAVLQGRAKTNVEIDAFYTLLGATTSGMRRPSAAASASVAMCRWATLPWRRA